jgi:hypothetical protein
MGDSSGGTLAATVTQLVRCMCNRRFNPNAKQAVSHYFYSVTSEI